MRCDSFGQACEKRLIRAALTLIVLGGFAPSASLSAQGDPVVIQGRVVDSGTGAGIAGAGLDLVGVGQTITSPSGAFRFQNVMRGRHTLVVEMLGYRSVELTLSIREDTTLTIELDVDPVQLDTIEARARRISVRGRVVDKASDRGLIDAEVLVSPDRETHTNSAGSFRVRRVPAARPTGVLVRALGYLPASIELIPYNDTTLRFELEPDAVARRMIARQVERLEVRSNAVAYRAQSIDREELVRKSNWTVDNVLRDRLGPRFSRIRCVVIDDRERRFGKQELLTYLPDELERIEIIDGGTMIRIYTRVQIQEMLRNRVTLTPIVLRKTPRGVICR